MWRGAAQTCLTAVVATSLRGSQGKCGSESTGATVLHRDRDSIFSALVRQTISALGLEEVLSAPRAPWQNPFAERVIGSIRREILDHVIVLDEAHARHLLRTYRVYYNKTRTHLSLKDAPDRREVHRLERGVKIVINTDSHHTSHLEKIRFGVLQARRAWLTRDDVMNTLPVQKFAQAIKHQW